jgi:hypothetical protein
MKTELRGNVLYEKVGRKYVPVSQYESLDYLRNGTYLIIVRPGCRSVMRMVHLVRVPEVDAALKIFGEGMMRTMIKKADTPKTKEPLTPEQVKAFKAWEKAFKEPRVWFPSLAEVAEAGLEELRKYFKESQ